MSKYDVQTVKVRFNMINTTPAERDIARKMKEYLSEGWELVSRKDDTHRGLRGTHFTHLTFRRPK